MPNLRIDLSESRRSQIAVLGPALHDALVESLAMEDDDLFQVFNVHPAGELRFSRTYPDADRTDIIFVQVIQNFGYSFEDKQRMYEAMTRNVAALGIQPDNLLISVHEIDPANWCAPSKSVSA